MGMPREHGFAKKLQNIPALAFQRIKGKKKKTQNNKEKKHAWATKRIQNMMQIQRNQEREPNGFRGNSPPHSKEGQSHYQRPFSIPGSSLNAVLLVSYPIKRAFELQENPNSNMFAGKRFKKKVVGSRSEKTTAENQ